MRTILRREEEHECFKSRVLLSFSSTLCIDSLYKAALDTVQITSMSGQEALKQHEPVTGDQKLVSNTLLLYGKSL